MLLFFWFLCEWKSFSGRIFEEFVGIYHKIEVDSKGFTNFAGSFDGEQGFMAEFYFKTPFSNDFTLKQTLDYPPISVLPSFMNETLQTAL